MATGDTSWSLISSLANNVQEGALFTLRAASVLPATSTTFNDTMGMNPRVGYQWGAANMRSVGESDDIVDTVFSKTALATLTPGEIADLFFVTDQRLASDWENVRDAATIELGGAAAEKLDTDIAANYSSFTGGTIGTAAGTLTWSNIIAAKATLRQNKVQGPFYCVLGEGQWYHLLNDVTVDASAFANAEPTVQGMVSNYYVSRLMNDVIFAVSPNLTNAAATGCYGAMYSPLALAVDFRRGFRIEPERDASRRGFELVASMIYATGVWDAARGVQLVGTDVIA